MRRKTIGAAGVLLAGLFLVQDLLWAGPPTQQVRSTVESVYTALLNSRQESESKKKKHAAAIKQAIARRFDFGEMAKRALGPYWARGGEWKVYDLVVDNVSVVNNYRAQFARIMNRGSFDDLLTKLRDAHANQMLARRTRPDPTLVSAWLLAQAAPNRPR